MTMTTYQTYTTTVLLQGKDTDAAFDAFWLAPFCPAPDPTGTVETYAARLQGLWRDAVARTVGDTYITETVECLLAEGVRFEKIDWLDLSRALRSQYAFA